MHFARLASAFADLESTPKRLEMTQILSRLFAESSPSEIREIMYLLQGRVGPPFEGIELGMGEKYVMQAISNATGHAMKAVESAYLKEGDLGLAAESLLGTKKQQALFTKKLGVHDVFGTFIKISRAEGSGSQQLKIRLLSELIHNSSRQEARYVVRIPLGKMRLGIGDPTILDAFSVMREGDKSLRERLERAYNVTSDLGLVAEVFYTQGIEGLDQIRITINNPIRPALCERLPTAEDILAKIGECAVEAKYDGFRMQIHKRDKDVTIFSRAAENMTHMFPEIVKAIREQPAKEMIIDCECLGYDPKHGKYFSFQQTMQRRRKYGIKDKANEIPLHLYVFDILYLNGREMIGLPYKDRRKAIEKHIKKSDMVYYSDLILAKTSGELMDFFSKSIGSGLEGIIAKDLNAPYTVGARKFAWIKLKKSYETALADTIDAVIVGYDFGKGKRRGFGLGTILTAAYDNDEDMFKTIAKVGSGFTEESLQAFREALEKIRIPQKSPRVLSKVDCDAWVQPLYVVELTADEITRSPMHTCGAGDETYALRFPRIALQGFRDKNPEEATTVSEIMALAKMQKRKEK